MGRFRVLISNGELDSTLPAALLQGRYMTPLNWQELCGAIREKFYPKVCYDFWQFSMSIIWGILTILCCVNVLLGSAFDSVVDDGYHRAKVRIALLFLVPIGLRIVFYVTLHAYKVFHSIDSVDQDVRQVLSDFSAKSPGVTFHLMQADGSAMAQQLNEQARGKKCNRNFDLVTLDYVLEISVDEEGSYRMTTAEGDMGSC